MVSVSLSCSSEETSQHCLEQCLGNMTVSGQQILAIIIIFIYTWLLSVSPSDCKLQGSIALSSFIYPVCLEQGLAHGALIHFMLLNEFMYVPIRSILTICCYASQTFSTVHIGHCNVGFFFFSGFKMSFFHFLFFPIFFFYCKNVTSQKFRKNSE